MQLKDKRRRYKEEVDVEIELNVNAFIPDSYIDGELTKIEMYKKIAAIESKQDMYDVQEEMEDRFSDIPNSVNCLLKIAYIKTLCKQLKIEKIRHIKDEIFLEPITKYKTKEKIGYNIVNELEELLEKMCGVKTAKIRGVLKFEEINNISRIVTYNDISNCMQWKFKCSGYSR